MENSRKSRLSEMLRKRPKDFAEREKKVYDYLLKKENRIQELKVADIADGAGVSKATVVRFCKTLGYDGLKDFKVGYEVGKRPSHLDVAELDFDTPYNEIGQSYISLVDSVFHSSFNSVNQSELMHIADKILISDGVRIIADSEARESASHAYSLLKSYISSLQLAENDELKKLTPSGLTIVFSFGQAESIGSYMKRADLLGFPCVLFTIDNHNKIASYSSHTISASRANGIMAKDSVLSKLVIDAFVDELYAIIAIKKGKE